MHVHTYMLIILMYIHIRLYWVYKTIVVVKRLLTLESYHWHKYRTNHKGTCFED